MLAYSWIKNKLGCFVFLLLAACGGGGGDSSTTITPPVATTSVNYTYTSSTPEVNLVSTPETDSADLSLSYTLDLGTAVKDVYLVFTNPTLVDSTVAPSISGLSLAAQSESTSPLAAVDTGAWGTQYGAGQPDKFEVNQFNSVLHLHNSSSLAAPPPPQPLFAVVGDSHLFYVDLNGSISVPATLQKTVTVGSKTLNIWVEDDSWTTTCNKNNCVDSTMLTALADKFLLASGNDIYDWVTNIFGVEWGNSVYTNLIPASNTGNITILLYDIDADDSTNGGVTGLFHSKDNYVVTAYAGSNERLMFYIDSVLFATPEGPSWDATDHWPSEIYGTLAHEFQHMINFYQKNIVNVSTSEVWLNEMSSLMAEDFVATKLGVDGPRGVLVSDPSAGSPGNTSGWLPTYCRYDYVPIAQWFAGISGEDNVLNSYAVNYSFGAYLARNYGGVTFFQNLVQNNKSDYRAINDALIAGSYADDFTAVLRKWGAAVLLSDDSTNAVPAGYRYNTGAFIDSTTGTTTYSLGSINMFNYDYSGLSGPTIYTSLPPADTMAGKYKTSNMFYKWGTGLSGVVSKVITIPQGSKLTVVIK